MKPRLRHCPTCDGDIRGKDLGLREYGWASTRLPGNIGPMDIDFMLERRGHVLIMEFKPDDVALSTGQRMTLRTLQKMGCDVWIVKGTGPLYHMTRLGEPGGVLTVTEPQLGRMVADWFEEASEADVPEPALD